jgi:hypothetical protein
VDGTNVGSSNAWYQLDFSECAVTPSSITITIASGGDVFDVGPVFDVNQFIPDATGQTSYTDSLSELPEGLPYLIDVYEGASGSDGQFHFIIS